MSILGPRAPASLYGSSHVARTTEAPIPCSSAVFGQLPIATRLPLPKGPGAFPRASARRTALGVQESRPTRCISHLLLISVLVAPQYPAPALAACAAHPAFVPQEENACHPHLAHSKS